MATALDFGSFTATEKTTLLAALKTELLRRAGVGSVQSGASTGQSFTMQKMSDATLIGMINSLAADLGVESPMVRVAPNFHGAGFF